MNNAFVALFIAAGVAAWAYSKANRRVGYGNNQSLWTITGVIFVISFIVSWTLANTLLNL